MLVTGGSGGAFTGRQLMLLAPGATQRAGLELKERAGIKMVSAAEVSSAAGALEIKQLGNTGVTLDEIGVAVVVADPDQRKRVAAATRDTSSAILAVEPERVVYVQAQVQRFDEPAGKRSAAVPPRAGLDVPPMVGFGLGHGRELLYELAQRYRTARSQFTDVLGVRGGSVWAGSVPGSGGAALAFPPEVTWGLSATGVAASRRGGSGVGVAVLDTGFDLAHPDFLERDIQAASFVENEAVQDGHGHGTHCIGTACGPLASRNGTRYGVAYASNIFAGKVLNNEGSGGDGDILAGINWAVKAGVAVVSMSLGAPVLVGQPFSQVFEQAASRAAAKGTLIVAAAGNESRRPFRIEPVGHPANCPSIMAVGAVDVQLRVAPFSNGGMGDAAGQVNIAGPGVDVLSSWPHAQYHTISGTSMATPHVAGIVALYAEATGLRGFPLANTVLHGARRLHPSRDFGWGLVQST